MVAVLDTCHLPAALSFNSPQPRPFCAAAGHFQTPFIVAHLLEAPDEAAYPRLAKTIRCANTAYGRPPNGHVANCHYEFRGLIRAMIRSWLCSSRYLSTAYQSASMKQHLIVPRFAHVPVSTPTTPITQSNSGPLSFPGNVLPLRLNLAGTPAIRACW